jgi:prevent-host-death family protein
MVTIMVTKKMRLPRVMRAADFKARCLAAMDQVEATGEPIVVTKRGRPVASLVPATGKRTPLRGFLRDGVRSVGDVVSPLEFEWDAARR